MLVRGGVGEAGKRNPGEGKSIYFIEPGVQNSTPREKKNKKGGNERARGEPKNDQGAKNFTWGRKYKR